MLTDAECKNAACPPGKTRARLACSGGLYLEVSPAGSKRWFLKYCIAGAEKQLALGSYPAVTLTAARKARDAAKLQKSQGADPVQVRKVEKLKASRTDGDTFKIVALEWYAKQAPQWSAGHAERSLRQLERDLFPWIGNRPMLEIHSMELLAALHKVEERGAVETADRVLMLARQVWEYWLPTTTSTQRNITEGLKARLTPYRGKSFAAIVEPVRFGELLRTKQQKEQGDVHTVPLPVQAMALLRSLRRLTGHGFYVFPGERTHDRPGLCRITLCAVPCMRWGSAKSTPGTGSGPAPVPCWLTSSTLTPWRLKRTWPMR